MYAIILCASCNQMSEQYIDEAAGMNGGFEVAQNGLPVNWLLYTPNTVPDSDFKILLDTTEYKQGKQSLKYEVESCSSIGGWRSPGFTRQFDVEKENVYTLQFWVKNSGTQFTVMAGGVSAMSGDINRLLLTDDDINEWTQFNYSIPISDEFDELRMEINILRPGMFWIDEIKLEKE